jgi:ATP-dependent helicase HepA
MLPLYLFVRSSANALGVGKLVALKGKKATIEYFDSPAERKRHREAVDLESVRGIVLDEQYRVHYLDPESDLWHPGRALVPVGQSYLVAFPNGRKEEISCEHLFVRWDNPIDEPTDLLAARVNETPFFHESRTGFVRALVEERAACAGMAGLLSSGIDLENHQIEVVRRVLQDPVQRYLLADEVGLGKTIEAGILIRQYALDKPRDHRILILAPPHLVEQWKNELRYKFHLAALLGDTIDVAGHDDRETVKDFPKSGGMLVIDEAHHIAALVSAPKSSEQHEHFMTIRKLALRAERLLLLSATPLLHNEQAFQAMLHFLDPVIYPLGDLRAFRKRVERWQHVAELFHVFAEGEAGSFLESTLGHLREMFKADERIANLGKELKPYLDDDVALDDPERTRLIRAIRAHISETYKLHRRLLRNRRGQERTEALLPGRVGLRLHDYDDPARAKIEKALDDWRTLIASKVFDPENEGPKQWAELHLLFVQLGMSDPPALDAAIAFRLGADRKSIKTLGLSEAETELVKSAPKAHGEGPALTKLRTAISAMKSDARHAALFDHLRQLLEDPGASGRPAKIVVFAALPVTADRIAAFLRPKLGPSVERHATGLPEVSEGVHGVGWQRFVVDPNCRVLICDRRAEDGLNLQGQRMILLHYDLPFAPNRIEQRMGRLDRYGVGMPVRSFAPAARQSSLFRAWAECLDLGFGVFEQSIASLQYLVDQEMAAIRRDLLMAGLPALSAATARLGGDGGSVRAELQRIQILDELDAIEVSEEHDQDFAERLKLVELRQKDAWKDATHTFVTGQLKFGDWGATGPNDPVRRYHFQRPKQGHQTLMPVSRLERKFTGVIDRLAPDWMRPSIYPITFDRQTAQRRRVLVDVFPEKGPKQVVALPIAVGWIGDSFIDALADYVRWDDRGLCFALWKFRPKLETKGTMLAFRFDFLVEADIAPAQAILAKKADLTPEAIRRQADQLFPPIVQTIWLNDSVKPILDAKTLALVAEPYDKGHGGPHGRDYNINQERWAALNKSYPLKKWRVLCAKAREAAEKSLREQLQLKELTKQKAEQAARSAALRRAQQESRVAHLAPALRKAEREALKLDEAIAAAIEKGIRKPAIRLDAIGAVFISKKDPFV